MKSFRDELINTGVKELLIPQDVDEHINQSGNTVVFVNSVCGCAADIGRPSLSKAMGDATPNTTGSIYSMSLSGANLKTIVNSSVSSSGGVGFLDVN